MNPRAINSVNINQFGFEAVFLLETSKLRFDIAGLTLFNGGGAAAVAGISFEVLDPSKVIIKSIDFNAPDISPDVASVFELDLPNGISSFGYYEIKGSIKDADGKVYDIVIPAKQVCEPLGWDKVKMGVPGVFSLVANCKAGTIRVYEHTILTYQGLAPYSKTKTGMLYYPQGTIAEVPFAGTPFENDTLYTGMYTIRNKTVARYNLGDGVFVDIPYRTTLEKRILCQTSIVDVLCCLDDVQAEYTANCNNNKGALALERINRASVPMMVAFAKERAGQDASLEIEQVRKILNCDCDCDTKLIEPQIVGGADHNFVFAGDCETTVTPVTLGNTTTVTIKKKNTNVRKKDAADAAIKIHKVVDNCNVHWDIEFDYDELASTILFTIKNKQELINYLLTIIGNAGFALDLVGLDGKCVIAIGNNNYVATAEGNARHVKHVKSVVINTNTYPAPDGTLLTDDAGIQAWLNSLGLGVFAVAVNPGPDEDGTTTSITTNDNPNSLSILTIRNQTLNLDEVKQFVASNATLKAILQATINYLCALSTTQVKLGAVLNVCSLDETNQVKQTGFGTEAYLSSFLTALQTSYCTLVNKVKDIYNLTCDKIKTLFPKRNSAFSLQKDYLMGTKDGACSQISAKELTQIVLATLQTDSEELSKFCHLAAQCGVGIPGENIPDINNIVGQVGLANINVPAIGWTVLPGANQTISLYQRVCPVGNNYPPDILVADNIIVLPSGAFQAAVNINPLDNNQCYELYAKNNAGGQGYRKQFQTLAPAAAQMVQFKNNVTESTMTEIRLNGVEFLAGNPVATGNGVNIDIGASAGLNHLLEFTFGAVAPGTTLFYEHIRNSAVIASGYFDYDGALADVNSFTFQNGDTFQVMLANRHLLFDKYTPSGGLIQGVCNIVGIQITRTAAAVADATEMNQTIRVTLEVEADNGNPPVSVTADFAPADAAQAVNVDLGGNGIACSFINSMTITDIIILP